MRDTTILEIYSDNTDNTANAVLHDLDLNFPGKQIKR